MVVGLVGGGYARPVFVKN